MREPDSRKTQAQVCQRCLMRLDTSAGGVDLPRRIRATLAAREGTEHVRVSLTGCLGYCPVGRVSVQLFRDGEASDVVLVDPERNGAELISHLPCPSTEAP
ncbi:(2Fe-2S) ferredoxin domain-containing protein [Archangium sp.]|jgi:predicted metal-binding protein|uniref:(2Fe-2S) ferredoxin domain-containing protein n=1 Tax=Archangium sp. TaxID=1872627 RepID=UPI002EDA7901